MLDCDEPGDEGKDERDELSFEAERLLDNLIQRGATDGHFKFLADTLFKARGQDGMIDVRNSINDDDEGLWEIWIDLSKAKQIREEEEFLSGSPETDFLDALVTAGFGLADMRRINHIFYKASGAGPLVGLRARYSSRVPAFGFILFVFKRIPSIDELQDGYYGPSLRLYLSEQEIITDEPEN